MRDNPPLLEWLSLRNMTTYGGEDGKQEFLLSALGRKKTYTAILEISMKIPQKTKDRTTTEPTIVLGIAQVWGTVEQA